MKLALSMLCENPRARTGLTTLFHEFIKHSLAQFPEVSWLLFAGPEQEWSLTDPRVTVNRAFPANDQLNRRLIADHFQVPVAARDWGADALVTIGFVPVRKCLPVAMHILSLQHLDPANRVGLAREYYRKWLTKFSWPKADLVITNSLFAKSQILSVYPGFADRLVQSYEGLQHEQFHPRAAADEPERIQRQFGFGPGCFLWISNLYPYKQAPLLLEAYARVPAEIRQRHPLVFVGGECMGQLAAAREQAGALNIAGDVKFIGWVGDEWLAPLYRQALAFCLPSREETFGRCVIEAMACGTPCAVNDIPIMREVTDGHAGIVDFTNAAAAAAVLTRFATDDRWRQELRAKGIQRAADFTFEKLALERVTAIHRMLTARKS